MLLIRTCLPNRVETPTRKIDTLSTTIARMSCWEGFTIGHITYFSVEWLKYPDKNFWTLYTDPQLDPYQCWISNKQLRNPTLQSGEGRERWNEPTLPILLSTVAVLEQRYATLRGVKTWNWKQNSRRNTKIPNKVNRKLMIWSIIRTSRHKESGIRDKFFSWSAIHGAFQIRESA